MAERLEALQTLLSRAFRKDTSVTDDDALTAHLAEHVAGNSRLTPAAQVDIYRRQFWLRHLGSLQEDYPGLRALLGDDAFETFCRAYLAAHPPASFTLRDLGDDIVPFAELYPDFPPDQEALCRELCRFEHAHIDLFDGAEPPPLDPARLGAMTEDDWSTARVVLHPLLRRFRLTYPVHTLREAARAGRELAVPEPRDVHLLLFRRDLQIRLQEIDPLAYQLLSALARGVALIPACEEIADHATEDDATRLGEHVQRWFAQWASAGLIVDITPAPDAPDHDPGGTRGDVY
ncbi:DNA-binding domain-containing protein [Chondromyces crocatus]|uniref:Uncharacterized protein n=1 Tax=Chondromyces crocatus TaxID=52 RepID=A0A0K1EGP4_CHOCO|nr:putative DNA-binding domain-containing protein [Chondromyces crocatus]AKT40019.1 uncharacterized protein CMC5_041720 [Chondromyces crocatus]